jgi:predicted dehydrogenase
MRFGVLGTGFWAREVHARALADHPSAQLVGIWGRDVAKAKAVGAQFDVTGYGDVDELLAQVDAVAFSLPPHVQAPLAVRAAEAGKHLLLEKPLALDVASADRVVTAVRNAGVASVVFVTFRFQVDAGRPHQPGRRLGQLAGCQLRARQPVPGVGLEDRARRALGHRPARALTARADPGAG